MGQYSCSVCSNQEQDDLDNSLPQRTYSTRIGTIDSHRSEAHIDEIKSKYDEKKNVLQR